MADPRFREMGQIVVEEKEILKSDLGRRSTKIKGRDFAGGPVTRTPCSQCMGPEV